MKLGHNQELQFGVKARKTSLEETAHNSCMTTESFNENF